MDFDLQKEITYTFILDEEEGELLKTIAKIAAEALPDGADELQEMCHNIRWNLGERDLD